jgi:hypothetical protein
MPSVLQLAEQDFDAKDAELKAAILDRKAARKIKDDAIAAFNITDQAVTDKAAALGDARNALVAAANQETEDAAVEPADPAPEPTPEPAPVVDPNAPPVVDPNAPVVPVV